MGLEIDAFNNPWIYQMSYVLPPPALVPLVISKFLAEHVTCQFSLLIRVAPHWMEAPWLPIVLNMLADVPHQYPIIKHPIKDISVSWVFKSLQLVH